ncbi:BTAD domain-containing putative transcriptional regulator [Actinomycetospora callitridis]|uniref:BTAD domain-containing putative transcriptional regulator n=1 Tax=Actinomycetospora callitridis TaxID=913944 RepID=UPI002364FE25|nr:BTAD domain-containing putative transcriptional regulator [Actinomycetospora callitridis]MDD7920200.1 BTAD domain-containing putative transcriptional regulator [Actinomycetospora callitridis]
MLTVAVLGRVEARRDGVPTSIPGGLTTELLVRLALDAGRPVRAERLVEDLWPDPAGVRPNTLQAKISQLRRALGDPALVDGGPAGYTLGVEPGDVDALEALRLAEAGATQLVSGDPAGAAATCRAGLALFGSEVLSAAGTAEWVLPHRLRLEEARARLTEDELAARLALGATGEIVGELESLVAVLPLREQLWSLLITALYRSGRQADALDALRRVTALLVEELGVDPGPELRALERQVLTHDQALRPAAAERHRGNLPAPTTPLVGRTADLDGRLADLDAHRLVTLVGPAGVGKTRLAIEVARRSAAPGGSWLVRLEGVRTAAELPSALAEAVPGADGIEGLLGAQLLIVLDNCEHLVEPVRELVVAVLDTAPGVRVLATSQRPLGLDGEVARELPPLPEPDAVALFAQSAAARRPSFALTADITSAVSQVCRALDCLPLAIELAAARTRILTVPEIAQRLDDRFTLLADPTSTRPERRRTLAAALSWSYDLLFPDDHRGLWALAPFPGGATMPAVEHVLVALGVPAAAALDVVERLVDRSLVTADPSGGDATRFRLLDSVRAFAADRAAEAGAADVAADALVGWIADLADEVEAGIRGHGQAGHATTTAAERATIDAALDRARVHDPETGLRIAVGFGWAWVLLDDAAAAGRLRTARSAAPGAPHGLRVTALLLESWHEAMSGDLLRARAALDAATALAGDDATLVELARWHGGFVQLQEGRPAQALADLQRCRADFACRGRAWEEGASALLAAFAHLALGDTAAARAAGQDAIGIVGPLGDAWGLQHAQGLLGGIARAEQHFDAAARHHAHAADAATALGFGGAAALHLADLGRAQHQGDDPAAADTLRRAADAAEFEGDLRLLADTRVSLAEVLLAVGDRTTAHDLLVAADRWYTEAGAGDGGSLASRLLATLRAEDGEHDVDPTLRAVHVAAPEPG